MLSLIKLHHCQQMKRNNTQLKQTIILVHSLMFKYSGHSCMLWKIIWIYLTYDMNYPKGLQESMSFKYCNALMCLNQHYANSIISSIPSPLWNVPSVTSINGYFFLGEFNKSGHNWTVSDDEYKYDEFIYLLMSKLRYFISFRRLSYLNTKCYRMFLPKI